MTKAKAKAKAEEATTEVVETPTEVVETPTKGKGPRKSKKVSNIGAKANLVVVATENPKRANSASYTRFQKYLNDSPATVEEAIKAGLTMGDIKYDIIHGSITVEGAVVEEYEVTPRGANAGTASDAEVEEAIKAGLTMGDTKYDIIHDSITVEGEPEEMF